MVYDAGQGDITCRALKPRYFEAWWGACAYCNSTVFPVSPLPMGPPVKSRRRLGVLGTVRIRGSGWSELRWILLVLVIFIVDRQ